MGLFGFLGDVINLLGAVSDGERIRQPETKMDHVQNFLVQKSASVQRTVDSTARKFSDEQLQQASKNASEKFAQMAAEREIERRNNR